MKSYTPKFTQAPFHCFVQSECIGECAALSDLHILSSIQWRRHCPTKEMGHTKCDPMSSLAQSARQHQAPRASHATHIFPIRARTMIQWDIMIGLHAASSSFRRRRCFSWSVYVVHCPSHTSFLVHSMSPITSSSFSLHHCLHQGALEIYDGEASLSVQEVCNEGRNF